MNTKSIFEFIRRKVAHYGSLGDMNLLIIPQPEPYSLLNIDFRILHEKIRSLNYNFKGQILISFNENNKKMVINQIYPDLTTTEIPIQLPSSK